MLSLVAVLGLTLGELRFGGIGLGIAGVLFAGIGVGHVAKLAEISLDAAMLDFVREFGLILFVYSIGIQSVLASSPPLNARGWRSTCWPSVWW